MSRYGLKLLFLIAWGNIYGLDCDSEELRSSYEELYTKVDAVLPIAAIKIADSLLLLLDESKNSQCSLYYWIQYEKGEAFEFLGQHEEALVLYYKVVKNAEADQDWALAAQAYISIARNHETLGRGTDCLRNLNAARDLINKYDLKAIFARFAVRFSSYCRFYADQDSAIHYARLAIEYGKEYQVLRSELDGNLLLGLLLTDTDLAIYHHQEAVNISLRRNDMVGASSQKLNIAKHYFDAGEYERSMKELDTAFLYANRGPEEFNQQTQIYASCYDLRRQYFEKQNMMDSAYYYLERTLETEQQANLQINQETISQQEMAFAIEREQEKLDFEKQQSKNLRNGLIAMGILLAILVAVLINNERKKRLIARQKDLITTQNEDLDESLRRQNLLLSEINHRVKNNLQLIVSLLTLQGQKKPQLAAQFNLDELSNKVYSIALIHEQLYRSGEFEKIYLQDYFNELGNHFNALQSKDNPFILDFKIAPITINLETVLPIGIICSELISNSLKYAQSSDVLLEIQLSLAQESNQYKLDFKDNGPGYPTGKLEYSSESMGGMLIYSMVRQLQAKSNSYNQDGAVFSFVFQEKQVSHV